MKHLAPDDATIRIVDDGWYLYLQWSAAESFTWQALLHDFKASFPHHTGRAFDPDTRTWRVPRHQIRRMEQWVSAWFTRSAQFWELEEPAGYAEGKAPAAVDAAYSTLHLLPSAPPEVVQAAHRALIKLCHPDAGGDHAAAVAINRAVDVIRQHRERIA